MPTQRLIGASTLAILALLARAALAAPPTSVPLGNHVHNFLHSDGTRVSTSGWDPAFNKSEKADKQALIQELAARGISTYDVGLPGSQEPDALRPWPFDSSETITDTMLSAARFPTIALTGVSGTVYFIDGYSNCGSGNKGANGCPTLSFGGTNTKVVVSHSAFGMIQSITGSPEIWVIDTLIDAQDNVPGGIKCQNCDSMYVMYSEILGGDDSCKLFSKNTLYRTHIHGAELAGSEHADGCQASGGALNVHLIETNMDFLFRQSNAGYWISTTFGDSGPVYHYRNMLGGGNNPTRIVKKLAGGVWLGPAVYRDNLYLGKGSNVSWRLQEWANGGSTPITVRAAGNIRIDGTAAQSFIGMPAPTSGEDAAVASEITKLTKWVSEIRARSGVTGSTPNTPPPPPPTGTLSAPTLLD